MFSQLTSLLHRPRISPWEVVDILIVSLLIYQALKLIRGTRAMQMAIGSLLVRSVLTYAVVAAIVLFQADIRRALSHLGSAPVLRYFARTEQASETIEEIVTASSLLASRRVGALIVLEREIGLRHYVESGIRLDAAVSYDLLTTIFQPGTPLHDGAVIIAEHRIAAAACFLPLSVNPKLDRDWGTRHRAGIGLTEESDALAVVVSEERGEISLARHGHLERALTPEALRVRLHKLILHRTVKDDAVVGAELDVS